VSKVERTALISLPESKESRKKEKKEKIKKLVSLNLLLPHYTTGIIAIVAETLLKEHRLGVANQSAAMRREKNS